MYSEDYTTDVLRLRDINSISCFSGELIEINDRFDSLFEAFKIISEAFDVDNTDYYTMVDKKSREISRLKKSLSRAKCYPERKKINCDLECAYKELKNLKSACSIKSYANCVKDINAFLKEYE